MSRRATGPARRRAGQGDPEQGSVAVWLLLIAPTLFAFAGLVLDGGRTISARQDAANLAEQAARTAVDQLSDGSRAAGVDSQFRQIDPGAARTAACSYVGSARPGASCSTTLTGDGQVQVSVRINTPTAILGVIGVRQLTASGSGQARPAFGATEEVPQ